MKNKTLKLKASEVRYLKGFVRKGEKNVRAVKRANVLLLLHAGKSPTVIKNTLNMSRGSIYNIRDRYEQDSLAGALRDKQRSGQPRKYTNKHEAEIIALACTSPPKGRKRWTVRLLTEHVRKKKGTTTIIRETIRLVLKKRKQSLG